jgi:hypothetical protein
MDTRTDTPMSLDTQNQRTNGQVPQPTGAGRVARRRLLTAAAATGVCAAAGVLAGPQLVPLAEQAAKDMALGEVKQLEGISLDAAIEAAEITRAAVRVIVLPVARLMAVLGSGALTLLLGTLDIAHNALSLVHASTDGVDQLHGVVASWQAGLNSLPIALTSYVNADITSAEAYLKALRKVVTQ